MFAEDQWQLIPTSLFTTMLMYVISLQQLGAASAWNVNNLCSPYRMQRQHGRSSFQRGIESLSAQRPCFFFSWPYMWRNSTNIKDKLFLQFNSEHIRPCLPIQPMGCRWRDFRTSFICRRLLLLIQIIILCNKKRKYIHIVIRLLVSKITFVIPCGCAEVQL